MRDYLRLWPDASALGLVLLCALSLAPGISVAAPKVEKSKAELSELHDKIESLKKELDDTKEAHADASDALKESEQAISNTNRKLYELQQQQQQTSTQLQALQQQQNGVDSELQKQQRMLSSQLYKQYLHGQPGYTQLFLQQENPAEAARQWQYYRYVAQARAELISGMQRNLDKLTRLNEETAASLQKLTDLKASQEAERAALQAQKNQRNKVLQSLAAKINSQRGQIDKMKRDEQRLSQLVEKLARLAAMPPKRKPQKPAATDKATTPSSPQVIARNEDLPTNAFEGGNFAALKGKLNLPVRGDITNRFGSSREDTGVSWKGLFIKSVEGSEVKSVASGRVVFADWLRGFGNLIIVDHGNSYMSLYGNNQALLKQVGDTVKGGDTIASVGNSGGNEASGLYFELRYQSKPFDPLSWSVVR
ncbi:septal ring factor EnvC (AmiA/AmiB activator) [Methylovorus glucosotrophus]|uniref:murein hydrolase activator EnvC family protein n=1 Tax=Methylovorus glucosotrophus TaxID=266009 RepID=UPI00133134D4|nr:peptidoglycan DD-metalloendopeptidase family protein [Methylovorus glucosotrophus]KAF0836411.1 septal ring factor EnvC (AmiA/AmiB activator) [Methylovorus glucosotrophus]